MKEYYNIKTIQRHRSFTVTKITATASHSGVKTQESPTDVMNMKKFHDEVSK